MKAFLRMASTRTGRWLVALVLGLALLALDVLRSDAAGAPPARSKSQYILRGYVPAGFDHYGAWTAKKATPLYADPSAGKPSASVASCETVDAERGEIRGRPWAVRVVFPHDPFRKGDRMWILARDLEEGYFQLWHRGELRDDLASELDLELVGRRCEEKPSETCWLWFDGIPEQVFWVRIRKQDGTVGWTRRPTDFIEGGGC
jgi:hypothetical protein